MLQAVEVMLTRTLYRPVSSAELARIAKSNYRRFPPRLVSQPYFYPVCTRAYAEQIAKEWSAQGGGKGYVTRFEVRREFLERYRVRVVGPSVHEEYRIPSDELAEFNDAIVGRIDVVSEY
jgi:hypothetical protein